MKTIFAPIKLALLFIIAFHVSASAEIVVQTLTKETAKKLGITMHFKEGKDSVKVWLDFKEEGALKNFSHAELRMKDAKGNFLLSAMLKPHPVYHGQLDDLVTVAFTAKKEQLAHCSFMVVAYAALGGEGYTLKVSDFLDAKKD